jgi:hypothetical protein
LAAADQLTIDDPILLPDLRWHLWVEGSFLEGVAELGAEYLAQSLDGHQELGVFGGEPLAIGREAASGHQIVDMGMVVEIARPGLEDADEAELGTDKARVTSELLQGC